ncbi:MAG: ATP-binding protein, partial [Opitutales bacterium]
MIRRHRLLVCAFLLLAVTGTPARAGWGDRTQGLPLLEFFSNQQLGVGSVNSGAAEDSRGRLFFAGEKLLVYDGAGWRTYPSPSRYGISRLCFGPDGRLWVGCADEIGYFTEDAAGGFHYTSLLDRLPPEQRNFNFVWDCAASDGHVWFFAKSKLLGWDGMRFTVYEYPTSQHLFLVRLGNEFWFTHLETGLYRITADGPKLQYPKSALPPNPAFHLQRRGDQIEVICNDGLFIAGRPEAPLSPPELGRFGLAGRISGIVDRPGGGYFISSLGAGLALVSAQGEVQRILDQEAGLPSNFLVALLVDREGGFWCQTRSGLVRMEAAGSTSLFNEKNGLARGQILEMASRGPDFWVLNDGGVHQLQAMPGSLARFAGLPGLAGGYTSMLPWGPGLLLARFTVIEQFTDHRLTPVLSQSATNISSLSASQRRPGTVYFLANRDLTRLSRTTDGHWESQRVASLPEFSSFRSNHRWEDERGQLWFNSDIGGITCYNPEDGRVTHYTDDLPADGPHNYPTVAGRGHNLYFASNDVCYRIDTTTGRRTRVGTVPGAILNDLQLSSDGTRLYVLFGRSPAGGGAGQSGLGYFTMGGTETATGWTELHWDGFPAIGFPSLMHLRQEDGADVLWIGGSEAILRVRPDELRPQLPPATPALRLSGNLRPAAGSGSDRPTLFPYAGHRILLRIETPEVSTRRNLLFQTRFGGGDAPWSPPSAQDSFEFNNLREGPYLFTVRSVNPAGMASPAAELAFRVLPPWYRTGWAYGGGALALLLGMFAVVRVRERQARYRNALLQRIVAERTAELVKANSAKDEFLAAISHEIRNPMNVIVGLATTMNTAGLDDTGRQRFSYLRHSATHLSGLLEDVLDFSKVQAGAVALDPQPFAVAELVQAITAITSAESQRLGLPVEVAISPAVPPWLVGDVARLRQILLNLVINALKYAGRGTICLTVWARPALEERAEVTFAVSDDGPGITPEEQQRLFTRFERGEAARRQRVAGAGLGLALCRELADKMGGRIWVESAPGEGSTFHLVLTMPIARGPATAPVPAPTARGAGRVLVVDDEEYNRVTLSALLDELGYTSVLAANADAALAAARTGHFDAVFLDFDLPGRNGPDIARELRTLPGYPPTVPIIAATAFNTPEKRDLCQAAGMSAFLS